MRTLIYDGTHGDVLAFLALDGKLGPNVTAATLAAFLTAQGATYDDRSGTLAMPNDWQRTAADLQLMDRVIEISPATLHELDGRRRILHRGQVMDQYLDIVRTSQAINPDNQYSAVGTLVPLATQWKLVDGLGGEILTPSYRYGYGPVVVDTTGMTDPIYKSPFDFYNWRSEPFDTRKISDQFIVEKPTGVPFAYCLMGQENRLIPLAPDARSLDDYQLDVVHAHSERVRSLFGADACEIIWFHDAGRWMFGACSLAFKVAGLSFDFQSMAERYVTRHFEGLDKRELVS